ncbi:hypothetical protein DM40_4896 [Burkholderia cenocepacia]|nr:hypothetical protein DM40_4896 [Burkholderia cenocepacia]
MSFVTQIGKPILNVTRSATSLPFRLAGERTERGNANEPIQSIRIQDTTMV